MNERHANTNARLDEYLSSVEAPQHCFMLSDLDGFLTGIACSPVRIPFSEWLAVALGGSTDVPPWVISAMRDRYDEIVSGLGKDPPYLSLILWEGLEGQTVAMDWCEGFMDAVSLRPNEWLRLNEDEQHCDLLLPIIAHLVDDGGKSVLGIPSGEFEEALGAAVDVIPEAIVGIWKFWRETG